jgi:hypothetical protein
MSDAKMTKRDWSAFFALLDKIVQDGRPWREKADEVEREADRHASATCLEEFTGWFNRE